MTSVRVWKGLKVNQEQSEVPEGSKNGQNGSIAYMDGPKIVKRSGTLNRHLRVIQK